MLDVDVPPLQWTVPLTMKVSKDGEISTITHTLKSGDAPVELEALKGADWVLPTAGGIGYFIWATDEDQYEAPSTHPPPVDLDNRHAPPSHHAGTGTKTPIRFRGWHL